MRLLERKNPFGPEEKTTPSVRNPALENRTARAAVAVVAAPLPPRAEADASPVRPIFGAEKPTVRLTDDTAGPVTPRPRLSLEAVPRIVVDASRIRLLPLGPRDAFLLAHVDGTCDVRMLIDITGMSELEVNVILEKLVEHEAVDVA